MSAPAISNISKLARERRGEERDGYVVREVALDEGQLRRARRQVKTDSQRKAIGSAWWEKVDVSKLAPAPEGWPTSWGTKGDSHAGVETDRTHR